MKRLKLWWVSRQYLKIRAECQLYWARNMRPSCEQMDKLGNAAKRLAQARAA